MSDWIVRENHPYDNGYWDRYDGKPPPSEQPGNRLAREGWFDCDRELRAGDIQEKTP